MGIQSNPVYPTCFNDIGTHRSTKINTLSLALTHTVHHLCAIVVLNKRTFFFTLLADFDVDDYLTNPDKLASQFV